VTLQAGRAMLATRPSSNRDLSAIRKKIDGRGLPALLPALQGRGKRVAITATAFGSDRPPFGRRALSRGPAKFDRHVLTLDKTAGPQTFTESGQEFGVWIPARRKQKPITGHRRLRRMRGERQRKPTQQRKERASFHVEFHSPTAPLRPKFKSQYNGGGRRLLAQRAWRLRVYNPYSRLITKPTRRQTDNSKTPSPACRVDIACAAFTPSGAVNRWVGHHKNSADQRGRSRSQNGNCSAGHHG